MRKYDKKDHASDFDWNDEGLEGAWRYINRVWRLGIQISELADRAGETRVGSRELGAEQGHADLLAVPVQPAAVERADIDYCDTC